MKLKMLALVLLIAFSARAQTFKNEFGFKSDNDAYLWYGQDRYYTNGLLIQYRHAVDQQKLNKLEKLTYEISAGQKMYNPISGYSPDPNRQDRPFAGYLYGGLAASFFSKKEGVLKTSLEMGIVGPGAKGEEAQDLLHRIVGFYEVQGWEYQIQQDLAVNLGVQYTKLLYRSASKDIDFSAEGYGNLGTTFSGAGAGILFRAGKINQLYNSATTNSIIGNQGKTEKLTKHEFFFYAKPQLNYVAYDATISGSLFHDDSPVTFDTKPFVFAQQLGFNYSSNRFTIDYSILFKSREVKSIAKPHQYGTISMYYRFGK